MDLKVSDVYTKDVITISPDTTLPEATGLMKERGIRRLPVVEDGKLIGIVTLLDVMKASPSIAAALSLWEREQMAAKVTVGEIMTKDVFTAAPGMNLGTVANLMLERKIGGVPVTRDGELVGIVTESDIFRAFVELLRPQR